MTGGAPEKPAPPEARPSTRAPRTPSRRANGAAQLGAVFRKEVLQTVRDRRMMMLLIIAPLVQTILFGYAVDFDIDDVPTVVVDASSTWTSRTHARRLLADGTLRSAGALRTAEDAVAVLDSGRAAAVVVLPKDLERDLLQSRSAAVQLLLDGTDPNRASIVAAAVGRYFGEEGRRLTHERMAGTRLEVPQIEMIPRVAFNPSLRSPPFMIPGVLGMLLLIVTTVVTAMGMTRERETGTLEQVLVTPIRPFYLLIGKMAPFLVIGLLDVVLVLTAGIYVFEVPLRGGLDALFVATLLYLMSTLGAGLFISTVSTTQQQSFLGGFLFMLPAILLSGVMTPIASMPLWLRSVTLVNPVRYYVEALRAILLKGAGFSELGLEFLALLAIGSALLALSVARFRKRLH